MSKRPARHNTPIPKKSPVTRALPDQSDKISWSFNIIDIDGPYCFSKIKSPEGLRDLLDKLRNYESLKYSEIVGDKSHWISVQSCDKQAVDRLKEIKLDDIDQIFSLRLTGKCRVFGLWEGRLFLILWYDPEHAVCPSRLKHT